MGAYMAAFRAAVHSRPSVVSSHLASPFWRAGPHILSRSTAKSRCFRSHSSIEGAEALARLCAEGLLSQSDGWYRYAGLDAEKAGMVDRLAQAYVIQLIPITNIIHQKPRRIREFADAFKFKSKREP